MAASDTERAVSRVLEDDHRVVDVLREIYSTRDERDKLLASKAELTRDNDRLRSEVDMLKEQLAIQRNHYQVSLDKANDRSEHYMRALSEAMAQLNSIASIAVQAERNAAHGQFRPNGVLADTNGGDPVPVPSFIGAKRD